MGPARYLGGQTTPPKIGKSRQKLLLDFVPRFFVFNFGVFIPFLDIVLQSVHKKQGDGNPAYEVTSARDEAAEGSQSSVSASGPFRSYLSCGAGSRVARLKHFRQLFTNVSSRAQHLASFLVSVSVSCNLHGWMTAARGAVLWGPSELSKAKSS